MRERSGRGGLPCQVTFQQQAHVYRNCIWAKSMARAIFARLLSEDSSSSAQSARGVARLYLVYVELGREALE